MIWSINETEGLLPSLTKNCETLIKQTLRRAEETVEFKISKPRESFSFKPPIQIEGSWIMRLTTIEVYESVFFITEESNKFELYKCPDSKSGIISYEEVRD